MKTPNEETLNALKEKGGTAHKKVSSVLNYIDLEHCEYLLSAVLEFEDGQQFEFLKDYFTDNKKTSLNDLIMTLENLVSLRKEEERLERSAPYRMGSSRKAYLPKASDLIILRK